jgi:serine/threonine protein kinase
VAIKTLPRISPEAAVRLQQEARTAATVSHPGLAAIYGIETWEGTPMLILEYLEGGTLSERLAKGPLPASEVVETGQIVAQALEVIHEFGILHRDVKPSNIGYTRHGDAKLLDFGIARIYQDLRSDDEDPSEIVTVDGRMMQQADNITGTLCYFSPEALDDEDPDPTFDLWSLTVVLYEALTAKNLFYRPRLKEMLKAIREAEVPDPSLHVGGCPPELLEFFRSELHPEKFRRSHSGREFYQRLERVRRALGREPAGAARERPARPLADLAS